MRREGGEQQSPPTTSTTPSPGGAGVSADENTTNNNNNTTAPSTTAQQASLDLLASEFEDSASSISTESLLGGSSSEEEELRTRENEDGDDDEEEEHTNNSLPRDEPSASGSARRHERAMARRNRKRADATSSSSSRGRSLSKSSISSRTRGGITSSNMNDASSSHGDSSYASLNSQFNQSNSTIQSTHSSENNDVLGDLPDLLAGPGDHSNGEEPHRSTAGSSSTTYGDNNPRHARGEYEYQPAPDVIPPEVTPGAFPMQGRAFGDMPAWFSAHISSPIARRLSLGSNNGTSSSANTVIPYPRQRSNTSDSARSSGCDRHRRRVSDLSTTSELSAGTSSNSNNNSTTNSNHRRLHLPSAPPLPVELNRNTSQGSLSSHGNMNTSPHHHTRRRRPSALRRFSSIFTSNRSLPTAELVHPAETVVYAQVQQQQEDLTEAEDEEGMIWMIWWELLLFAIMVLCLGIWIGRWTSSSSCGSEGGPGDTGTSAGEL